MKAASRGRKPNHENLGHSIDFFLPRVEGAFFQAQLRFNGGSGHFGGDLCEILSFEVICLGGRGT